nr:helix-turn-helix domain-containing protein [uncultured Bdellovibrio sp.]
MPVQNPNKLKLHPMHAFGVVGNLQTPLRIQRFEDRFEPLVPFPHKHSFYHLVIVTAGRGWHEIDFQRYPIEKGRVFLMKPAQVHSWVVDKNSKGFVIEFEEDILSSLPAYAPKIKHLLKNLSDSFLVKSKTDLLNLQNHCESLLREYEEKQRDYEMALSLSLFLLLIEFSRWSELKESAMPQVEAFATKYLNLVEDNFRSQHEVGFYAKRLGMTAKALTMKITRMTGRSARTLIQERLILESKRLLAYSDLSITEIADALGYQDANYFSRFFRVKTQKTPAAFRQYAKKVT